RAATPPTAIPLIKAATVISEEHAQVLGIERRLVEHHPAAGDLPADTPVDTAQQVLTGADEELDVVLEPGPVEQEVAVDLELLRVLGRDDAHVGEEVPGARRRVLGPGHAGLEPDDAPGER